MIVRATLAALVASVAVLAHVSTADASSRAVYGVQDDVVNWQPNGVANYPIIRGVSVTD